MLSQAVSRSIPQRTSNRVPNRVKLIAAAAIGLAVGFAVTGQQDARAALQATDAELVTLLRAMAVLKLALVAGALWLVDWRMHLPISRRFSIGYLSATALMCAGPGLIWNMAHVMAGATLLHGGLAVMIGLACLDDGRPSWSFTVKR